MKKIGEIIALNSLNSLSKYLLSACLITILGSCVCSDNKKPKSDANKTNRNEPVTFLDTFEKETNSKNVVTYAEANIASLKENAIEGKVTFKKVEDGILVTADIKGLTPGEHGFHVHEYGDCGKSGTAVGAHFNPTDSKHGSPESLDRHVGDLGNLVADESGHAHYEKIDKLIKLEGRNSIIGRSIIIHADKDDFVSQPAGASGEKIACGVIQAVSE